MQTFANVTPQQLRRAADIQERILALQGELNSILGAPPVAAVPAAPRGRRRKLSSQAIANIRAGVLKRMAARGKKPAPAKKRRVLSAAGRRRLSELAKARWAKAHAQGKSRL